MNTQEYFSHGKLLITGEYFVIQGALALALPVRFGQSLSITPANHGLIEWKSHSRGQLFMHTVFDRHFKIKNTNNHQASQFVQLLLQKASSLSGNKLIFTEGFDIETNTTFDISWGMGSSSTFIANMAQWFQVDPYTLQWSVSNGSGYDIACTIHAKPVLYCLKDKTPNVQKVNFSPVFKDNLLFVYSGHKELTESNISKFNHTHMFSGADIQAMTKLTRDIHKTNDFELFDLLVQKHNTMVSKALGLKNPFETINYRFDGTIKPLGAWGGDFFIALSQQGAGYIKNYFLDKGYLTFFSFDELFNHYE